MEFRCPSVFSTATEVEPNLKNWAVSLSDGGVDTRTREASSVDLLRRVKVNAAASTAQDNPLLQGHIWKQVGQAFTRQRRFEL